jgi:hypothetical protein
MAITSNSFSFLIPDYNTSHFRSKDRCLFDNIDFHKFKYCHVWGICVTNNIWFWIGWLDLLALLYSCNQLWQLTISDCLWLAPLLTYWTTSVFSSTVMTDELLPKPMKLFRPIKMCLNETYSKVRVGKHLSNFAIQHGLKQGDALSPLLFNFVSE